MTQRDSLKKDRSAGFRGRRGQILLITGMALPVLLGFLGLAIDVGQFYHVKRRMQFGADGGAVGGAWEIWRGNTGRVQQAALEDAKRNGFDDAESDTLVTVNHPPKSGPHTDDSNYVEVIIERQVPTYFLQVVNQDTATIRARAVAGVMKANPDACVYVLDPTERGALTVDGSAALNTNCGIMVNSNNTKAIIANGGACITASPGDVGVTGDWVANGSDNCIDPDPVANVWPMDDPLAAMAPPPIPLPADAIGVGVKITGGTVTLNPGLYLGDPLGSPAIDISGGTVTFNPGTYILSSGMSMSGNAVVTGIGVTFYSTNILPATNPWNDIDIAGTVLVDLRAPTTGDYAGILFWNDPASPELNPGSVISGAPGSRLDGVLYFPTTKLVYTGTSSTADWTMIIADTMKVSGTTDVNGSYSNSPIPVPIRKVTLVE